MMYNTSRLAAIASTTAIRRYPVTWRNSMRAGHGMALPDHGAPIFITGHERRLAEALAESLRSHGASVIIADQPPLDAQAVIDTSGLSDWSALPIGSAQKAAIANARHVARHYESLGGIYVVLGRSAAAWHGGQAELAKTAALEWPKAMVKAILLDQGIEEALGLRELARRIMEEMMEGGPEVEVVLTSSGRLVAVSPEQALAVEPLSSLPERAVLVVSGGARGVTADCLVALARTGRYRFALLGRSQPEPWPAGLARLSSESALRAALIALDKTEGRVPVLRDTNARVRRLLASVEIDNTLARLQALGSEARYLPCDVEDELAVNEVLAGLRGDWGGIYGLIHGAGVLADKRIADKTDPQIDSVFGPKVAGLKNLLDALREDSLALLVLFSSVAARSGNVGQVDYAMANGVLNQIAHQEAQARPDCLIKSIGWGPWDGGMVDETLRRHFQSLGIALIPLSEGSQMFVHELLLAPREQQEVVISGPFLPPERSFQANFRLGSKELALIEDHVIRGRAVLPIVLAVQAMLNFGRALLPDLPVVGLDDFYMLAGVSFEQPQEFAAQNFRLNGTLQAQAPGRLAVTLATADGRVRYRATVIADKLGVHAVPTPLAGAAMRMPLPEDIYRKTLFHGPALQVIQGLGASRPEGIDAQVRSGNGEGLFDPLLCDGGLQVAIVWAVEQGLWPSLPMGFDRLRLGTRPAPESAVTLNNRVTSLSGSVAIHDLIFQTPNGPVMQLSGLRMCRSPQPLVDQG